MKETARNEEEGGGREGERVTYLFEVSRGVPTGYRP